MLSVIILSIIMLSIIMLSVVKLIVILLSVAASVLPASRIEQRLNKFLNWIQRTLGSNSKADVSKVGT
jgi:hypothetical protein